MYLYINTSNHQKITLALIDKKGQILNKKNIKAEYQQSEKLLSSIEKIIANCKPVPSAVEGLQIANLKGIIVVIGPGSFTSLRIGVATANAMAWALNIPVVGVENSPCEMRSNFSKGKIISQGKNNGDDKKLFDKGFKIIYNKKTFKKQVLPMYGKEPNITVKSKK